MVMGPETVEKEVGEVDEFWGGSLGRRSRIPNRVLAGVSCQASCRSCWLLSWVCSRLSCGPGFSVVPMLSLQNDVVLRVVLIFSKLNINTTLKAALF